MISPLILSTLLCSSLLTGPESATPEIKFDEHGTPDHSMRSEAKSKAVSRAQKVPIQMGINLSNYLMISLDRNEPEKVMNSFSSYIMPAAIENDWWIVIFTPQKVNSGLTICVYLDKNLDVVRGYIVTTTGPKLMVKSN